MPDLSDEPDVHLLCGDAHDQLCSLPTDSVDCAVTSPPYFGLRDYGHTGQYGLERTPQEYADVLVRVSAEVARVLHPSGTFWLNVADCYGGGGIARPTGEWPDRHNLEDRANGMRRSFDQEKCLLGIPAVIERALVADGWVVRNRIIWAKRRPLPSNGKDRLDAQHEIILLLVRRVGRRPNYYFDKRATGATGDVWAFRPDASSEHGATFPVELPDRCIRLGCPPGGTVLDPFMGSGTTGVAAVGSGRNFVGIDLVEENVALAERRIAGFGQQLDLLGLA